MTSRRTRRPIPLAGLRGFDAAARHASFTLAARELHLTQSSVSRQIQSIEAALGRPLFVRKTRAIALTPAGQRLARSVRAALEEIDALVDDLRSEGNRRRVGVTTYASFASLWLLPRLSTFSAAQPEVDIRIDASDAFIDLAAEGLDVAIRNCRTDQAPHDAIRLMDEAFIPALSPRLAERAGPIRSAADLARLTLLVLENASGAGAEGTWEKWFQLAGVRAPLDVPRIVFGFVDQSMQAAVRGQGVVLARTALLADFVARGELVTPVPITMRSRYRYFLVTHPETREAPHVRAFCEWLLRETGATPGPEIT